MRILIVVLALLSLCALAQAEPCKSAGSRSARELSFDLSDAAVRAGMRVSFELGLLPESFPGINIAEAQAPCKRGSIMVGGNRFDVLGDEELSPQRWAASAKVPGIVAFMATVPRPQAANVWAEKSKRRRNMLPDFGPGDWMQVLVLAQADQRSIYAYYDDTPDDERLKAAFQAALSGQLKLQARFNVKSRAIE